MQDKIDFCKQYIQDKGIDLKALYNHIHDEKAKVAITELHNQGYTIEVIGKSLYNDKPDYVHIIKVINKCRPFNISVADYYGSLKAKQRVRGCYNDIKLITVDCCTVNNNVYFSYLVENQENCNQYIITVRYKETASAEELNNIQGLVVEGRGENNLKELCFPILDGNLNVKSLLYMGISVPDILPLVIHLILNIDKEKAEVLKNEVNKELYEYVLDTLQGNAKGLDYQKDIESHLNGTCECWKH